ncbi:hypothetical protein [Ectobacillus sp. JY-23]|uniref:hypothetical protein n=1 Tax=Ectobacillus sp. JY-23 TaxID=2933872 RepID=UPI00349FF6D0
MFMDAKGDKHRPADVTGSYYIGGGARFTFKPFNSKRPKLKLPVKRKSKGIDKPFTKSSLKLGQQMHKSYKTDEVLQGVREKEFRLPSRKRIDFIDFEKKIIYELKPYNPRAMRQGNRQLKIYKKEVEGIFGPGWKTKLDVY